MVVTARTILCVGEAREIAINGNVEQMNILHSKLSYGGQRCLTAMPERLGTID